MQQDQIDNPECHSLCYVCPRCTFDNIWYSVPGVGCGLQPAM